MSTFVKISLGQNFTKYNKTDLVNSSSMVPVLLCGRYTGSCREMSLNGVLVGRCNFADLGQFSGYQGLISYILCVF